MVTASRVSQYRIRQFIIFTFLLLVLSISIAAFLYYTQQKKNVKADKQRELLTLAAFKISEIREWREKRIEDAQLILDNVYFPSRVQAWLNNESVAWHRQEILSWLSLRGNRLDYKDIYLLDAKGAVRLSTEKTSEPIAPHLLPLVTEALRTQKPVFSDLYTADNGTHIHIDLLVPLLLPDVNDTIPVGVLLFRIDPHRILYPLLQAWPARSDTGETLLVRREGESVLFLNELRYKKNSAMAMKLPLIGNEHLLAAVAVQGQEGDFEGRDYRGTAVLAAVKAVPDSPWFLIIKIDEQEVLGPLRRQTWFISILVLGLVVAAGISSMLFLLQQQATAERRQYELELDRQRVALQYEYLKKYANDIILLFDKQGPILEANDRAIEAYGYSREELLQMHVSQLRPPETRAFFEDDMLRVSEQGGRVFETLHQQKDGTVFPVEVSARITELEGRRLYQSIIRDITERKMAEEEIRKRDVLLSRVAKSSSELLSAIDLHAVIPRTLEGLGRDAGVDRVYVFKNHADPQAGEHLMSQMYEWAHETVTPQINNPQLQGLSYSLFPGWYETLSAGAPVKGLTRDFSNTIRGILDPEDILSILLVPLIIADTFWGFIGFDDCKKERLWSDSEISILLTLAGSIGSAIQRHQTEQELISTRDFLENIFSTTADGIIVTDARGYITRVNQAISSMTGFAEEELTGRHIVELFPPDEAIIQFGQKMMTELWEQGFLKNFELSLLKKDGSFFPVEMNVSSLKDRQGNMTGAVSVTRDIMDRKLAEQEKERLQAQLYQSQKMEAVGHLAGGIAHDFNNILTAIMGYGSLLQAKLQENDPLRNHVDQILTSAERAAALVRSLLAYSRKQIINPQPVRINDIVINVENMLHRIIGEDIDLQTALSEQDTTVVADAGQVEQLLINLATNARDAMPGGGSLTITSAVAEMDEQFIKAHGYGTQGIYVLLTVSDTGNGMDEKTLQQIFEPFFTTKEVGKGTGLGLSTVYGIVKQHNGYINCYSEPGKGTTFKIYLPLVKTAGPAVQPSAIATPPILKGGSETILLAEDDDDLRELIKQILEDFGYTVIEARDGDEAVKLFMTHRDTINLLLLDVIMPKKNGREAYAEITKVEPAIKTLFTSGYTADIIHKQGLLEKGLEFIVKPVSPTELLKKVRDVLDT